MSQTQIYVIELVLGLSAVFIFLWRRKYGKLSFNRNQFGDNRGPSRATDKRKLTPMENKQREQAYLTFKEGKIQLAAQMLESLRMQRDAITILENGGFIHDATAVLKRMHRYDRAGAIYFRHGFFNDAYECFNVAKVPVEAAKAAREGGQFVLAAQKFEEARRFDDAAECWGDAKQYLKAAKILNALGHPERAMDFFKLAADESKNKSSLPLDEQELSSIVTYLSEGKTHEGLADVLIHKNKITFVILNLVRRGQIVPARELFLRSTTDLAPILISEVNLEDGSGQQLAELFLEVANFKYAGMLFERLSLFDQAGDAYERGEEFSRASYCYDRSNNPLKNKEMKTKITEAPPAQSEDNSALRLDDFKGVFLKSEFISELDFNQRNTIWRIGFTKNYSEEHIILDYQNDPAGIYTIVKGIVSCYRMENGRELYLDRLTEGESFGELWLLADHPSSVKFIATPGSAIHVVERTPFIDLLERDASLARKVYKRFTYRLLKRLVKFQEIPLKTRAS